MNTLKKAFEITSPKFSKILKILNSDLVIYDFNQPWAVESASSMNIPAIQFLPFSVTLVALVLHMFYKPGEKFPFPEIYLREYEMLQIKKSKDEDKALFVDALSQSHEIVLVKTCRDFEGKYVDYLLKLVSKKIVPVGSLVQDSIDQDNHDEEKIIMQWLDKKEKGSTIFVSFGSEYFLTKEEIHEVAQGLELSKVSFIWVIRFPQGEKLVSKMYHHKVFLKG